jgi:hypothetical protein
MELGPRLEGNAMFSLSLWEDEKINAVLGQFFDAKTRRVYDVLTDDYCERKEDHCRTSVRSTLEVIEIAFGDNHPLEDFDLLFKKNFAAAIDKAILQSGQRFPIDKKTLLLKHLPRDIASNDLIEVYEIPSSDVRKTLRGQNGVRMKRTATAGLAAGSFLGVYRGRALIGFDEYKDISYATPGMNFLEFELEIDSYTASCDKYNIGLEAERNGVTFEGMSIHNARESQVEVCAARYGNITALVNDPSIYPMGNSIETVGVDNTCLVECVVGGWPFLCMFASRDIDPGEELRYSYGSGFWGLVKEEIRRLEQAAGRAGGNRGGGAVANGGPLVDAAATPMRARVQPSSAPRENTQMNSGLEPTEELAENDDGDGDDDDETGGDSNAAVVRPSRQQKPSQQPSQPMPEKKRTISAEAAKRRAAKQKEKKKAERALPAGDKLPSPTKAMLASPHGKRVIIYRKGTPQGRFQAQNNGYASREQYDAVKILVRRNPKIESGGSSGDEGNQRVRMPLQGPTKATKAAAAAKAPAPAAALNQGVLANGNGAGPSWTVPAAAAVPPAAAAASQETSELNSLTKAVEAGEAALAVAKRKLDTASKLVEHHRRVLAELQPPVEDDDEEAPPQPPAPSPPQRPLWTQKPLFQIFIENSRGGEDLWGPWDISQLEQALDDKITMPDREVFLSPDLESSDDVEMREALESLGPVPEVGVWGLAELLHAAHPEALAAEEAETPAGTAGTAAAGLHKTKRLHPQRAKALNKAEKQLNEALEKLEEKEKLVQDKKNALSLARKNLKRRASGEDDEEEEEEDEEEEDEEEEEVDPEVRKANERSAGKRPAPSDAGGSGRVNGNGTTAVVKYPKLAANQRTPIRSDGAGTSVAHAAAAAAAAPAAADAIDVVDLTFDSD